jgi:hypothetical protein
MTFPYFIKCNHKIIENYIEEIDDKGAELSNYVSINLNDTECCKTENSVVIQKFDLNFTRLYFLTNNKYDLENILKKVKGKCVINYPTAGDIASFNAAMTSSGFKLYKIYNSYYNNGFRGNNVFVEQFAEPEDFSRVKYLLYNRLDVYADHLPDDSELLETIQNRQVLVNFDRRGICGIFIFKPEGKKCYFNFWVDTGSNGLFLLFNMFAYLKQKDIQHSYLWVDSENEKVKRIHELFGCKLGSVKDYIYIKG